MRISRRSLRKGLVVVGCLVAAPSVGYVAFGSVSMLLGCALHLWSKGCLEQNRRLITAGPYRYTRNPFYVSNLLIDAGMVFVIGQWWVGALYGLAWWVAYRDTIDQEEATLASLFPDTYPRYVEAVPRLFPNGLVMPEEEVLGYFSFDNDGLARGREYARLLGIVIGPLAILAAALLRRDGFEILDSSREGALAFCLLVPVLWVWKLALADVFQRPETRLVPMLGARAWLVLLLILAGLSLSSWHGWAALLPLLWIGLLGLDHVADRRRPPVIGETATWPRRAFVSLGSTLTLLGLAVVTWGGA